jgi:SAP domain
MSRKIEDFDMENLSEDDKQYLRERQWLPQPPGDEPEVRGPSDWNEDDHETVPLNADGTPFTDGQSEDDEEDDSEGPVDDNGDPVTLDEDGEFASFDYGRMTNARLKEFCADYELPVSGNKAELIARLEEYDALPPIEE